LNWARGVKVERARVVAYRCLNARKQAQFLIAVARRSTAWQAAEDER
jgi:hypothetical protein